MSDRFQTVVWPDRDVQGAVPTPELFLALMRGIDTLGDVLDVGCAEGSMSVLAALNGASYVLGIDTDHERLCAAKELAAAWNVDSRVHFFYLDATRPPIGARTFETVILSLADWLGERETRDVVHRFAHRNVAVIAEDSRGVERLRQAVGGVRTHIEQHRGTGYTAAVYRIDMHVEESAAGAWVLKTRPGFDAEGGLKRMLRFDAPFTVRWTKDGYALPFVNGYDLHGDPPFTARRGRPVRTLTGPEQSAVRKLARDVAQAALFSGYYPAEFGPSDIIISPAGATLVDLDTIVPLAPGGRVAPEHMGDWHVTLRAANVLFTGDLGELLGLE